MDPPDTVESIEIWLDRPLPEPYRTFLAGTPENRLAADDITLVYGRESVVERNDTFEAMTYCPGHLAVGDDGGGTIVVLCLGDGRLYGVDAGSMAPADFSPVAADFGAWVTALFGNRRPSTHL